MASKICFPVVFKSQWCTLAWDIFFSLIMSPFFVCLFFFTSWRFEGFFPEMRCNGNKNVLKYRQAYSGKVNGPENYIPA